jgi:hypothetical protein
VVSPHDLTRAVEEGISRLRESYASSDLAIILVDVPSSPRDDLEQSITTAVSDIPVMRPVDAKGKEFLAGLVVDATSERNEKAAPTPGSITLARY